MKNVLTFYVNNNVENKNENLFGKWFGKIIDDSGLKKKNIAELAGIYPGSLSRILSGEIGVARETAIALMKAVNELKGKQLCDIEYGLSLIFGAKSTIDPDLLQSVRFELYGSDNWDKELKEDFLRVLKITVAGIKAKQTVQGSEPNPPSEPILDLGDQVRKNVEEEFGPLPGDKENQTNKKVA